MEKSLVIFVWNRGMSQKNLLQGTGQRATFLALLFVCICIYMIIYMHICVYACVYIERVSENIYVFVQ